LVSEVDAQSGEFVVGRNASRIELSESFSRDRFIVRVEKGRNSGPEDAVR